MSIIGKKNDYDLCALCQRKGCGAGYAPKDRAPVLWLCQECIPAGKEAYAMNGLDVYEKRAVFEAAKVVAPEFAEAMMEALWSAGIRDLSAATPESFEMALESLTLNGGMIAPMEKAILAFGQSIRAQINGNEPPF
jgi:hypothetical protein